jgi:hypothetical protein
MRRLRAQLWSIGLALIAVGCAGPHSSGALWAQQNLDAERATFRLGDQKRAELAQQFELSVVDERLNSEFQRIQSDLQVCPGPRAAFTPSRGDTVRDGVRIHVLSDGPRLTKLSDVALADWFVRRANATGDTGFCARAQQTLEAGQIAKPAIQRDLLDGIPAATVLRYPTAAPTPDPTAALSNYALGYTDSVTAPAPLPQYLALIYGGDVNAQAETDAETAATRVDAEAMAYPEWEPDALYAALRGGKWP